MSTNAHEGFHSRLRMALETSATYWSLIDALTDMEAASRANRLEDIGNGHNDLQTGSSRVQKEKRIEARAELREIVTKIDEFQMVDYLKNVGYFKGHL